MSPLVLGLFIMFNVNGLVMHNTLINNIIRIPFIFVLL